MRYCVTITLEVDVPDQTPDPLLGRAIRDTLTQSQTASVALEWAGDDGVEPPAEYVVVPAGCDCR